MWRLAACSEVPDPLEHAEEEKEKAEGEAHHGHDESHPAAVGVGALRADSAEECPSEQRAKYARAEGPAAPLEQLAGAVVIQRSGNGGRCCGIMRP